MQPAISVIIPVFNTEKYIGNCINSIIGQTLKDIEIICVNDCSADNSLKILQDFSKRDIRIKIINLNENKGVSNARNTGMDIAQGEYIYFIDSDDWIDENYLEEMLNKIKETNSDVIINANFVKEYDNKAKKAYGTFNFLTRDFECFDSKIIQRFFPPVIWTRLYKREYLNQYNFKFPSIKCGAEDIYFAYACDLMQDKSYVFKGPYHHYFQRQTSAMHSKERGFHYFESFKLLYSFLNTHKINLDDIKLFFVESLIIDNEQKFNFIKTYLNEIKDVFYKNINIYNEQEKFLFNIMKEFPDFKDFISKYNPNISLSFLKNRMVTKK
ncbi:glycosyltransferase family 2 protein [Candidatus Ruminimicrobiellum ovillum]|uniref:glycosyltransferase family 2 protein n=1 Tax=Candidatus Ruminimicrobiellum ovillum TaxID=1947927 RepID=UPI00355A12AF